MRNLTSTAAWPRVSALLRSQAFWSVAIAVIGVLVYRSTFTLHFFWEDPFDIGQVDGRTFGELFFTPNSNSYYRPLVLTLFKLLRGSPWPGEPLTYHLPLVGAHIAAAVLLLGFARRLLGALAPAVAAALLFLLYAPGYEAVSRAASHHPWLMLVTIGALWSHLRAREADRHAGRWHTLSIALAAIGAFLQENGVLIAPMIVLLELYLLRRRRVRAFSPLALAGFVPAALFVLVWLSIPKPVAQAFTVGAHPLEFLYVSQGLSYPIAGALSASRAPLSDVAQAVLALAASLLLLLIAYRRRLSLLLLLLGWWLLGVSLAWLAREMDYLAVAPRVMYFASMPAALLWGGVVLPLAAARWRTALRWACVALVAAHSLITLRQAIVLYERGSALMTQAIAAGSHGGRHTFVNFPDRFEYQRPLYPLGYWGMLLAPVSQDLGAFVRFATGAPAETRSLTARPLADADIKASPYAVNTRGVEAYDATAMYEAALWADATHVTRYARDGALTLETVGRISAQTPDSDETPAVQGVARLVSGTVLYDNAHFNVTLVWDATGAAQPTDTLFVQVLGPDGALVAQADGDSLGGLIRPSAWRPGQRITDRRALPLNAKPAPGRYRVITGLYSRSDGRRLAAVNSAGQRLPDDAIVAVEFDMP